MYSNTGGSIELQWDKSMLQKLYSCISILVSNALQHYTEKVK
jgi:hypothetical protein